MADKFWVRVSGAGLLLLLEVLLLYVSFPNRHLYLPYCSWVSFVPLLVFSRKQTHWLSALCFSWGAFQIFFSMLLWFPQENIPSVLHVQNTHYGTQLVVYVFPFLYAIILTCISRLFRNQFSVFFLAVAQACLWVLFEYIVMEKLIGFPLSLAITQFQNTVLLQVASVAGIYGVSGILFLANACIALSIKRFRWISICLGCVLLLGVFGAGLWRISHYKEPAKSFKISMIQPRLTLKNSILAAENPLYFSWYTQDLFRMTMDAKKKENSDLFIWPETALVHKTPLSKNFLEFKTFVKRLDRPLLLGCRYIQAPDTPQQKTFNAVYYYQRGNLSGMSFKTKLVPFFETDSLECSTQKSLFIDVYPQVHIGSLLCFELLFPEVARTLSSQGATLLVCLANTSYLERSNWPLLHAAYVPFRSVEQGVPMVFVNMTGSSVVCNAWGKIGLISPFYRASISTVRISNSFVNTVYGQYPHLWIILTFILLGISLGCVYLSKREGGLHDI